MACLKTAQIAVRFANVAYAFQRPTSRVTVGVGLCIHLVTVLHQRQNI